MPYYCQPRFPYIDQKSDHVHISLVAALLLLTPGTIAISNRPVQFCLSSSIAGVTPNTNSWHNANIASTAFTGTNFNLAIYSFNSVHFASTSAWCNLLFNTKGCALFHNFTLCPNIFATSGGFLHHIRSSSDWSIIHCYLFHSQQYSLAKLASKILQLQESLIITQLQLINLLSMVVIIVYPNHDCRSVRMLVKALHPSIGSSLTHTSSSLTLATCLQMQWLSYRHPRFFAIQS